MAAPVKTRTYDSTGRQRTMLANRVAVLEAALALIASTGYATTTIAAVAGRAGVSTAFVYKQFGDKPTLARQLLDFALAGDDAAIPMSEREVIRQLVDEPDARAVLRMYAGIATALNERAGALLVALAAAAASDATLAEVWEAAVGQRLIGAGRLVADLASKSALLTPVDRARDVVWALISPELHSLLVVGRGWSGAEYREWLASTLEGSLLGSGDAGQVLPGPTGRSIGGQA